MLRLLALSAALLVPVAVLPQEPSDGADGAKLDLEVTYVGNEGFLFEAGGRKVLIDAFVSQSAMHAYVLQGNELATKLRTAAEPYADVDLILATHVHRDHFDPLEVGLHMAADDKPVLVTTEQAVAKLKTDFGGFKQIKERVHAVAPAEGEPVVLEELGLTIFNLHHGKDRAPVIENNAYVFEIGGHKILHMGDSEATAEELDALGLDELGIDIAFVPSWYVAEQWDGAIQAEVKPKQIVLMHLAPRWHVESRTHNQSQSRRRMKYVREHYPDMIGFDEYESKRVFPGAE